VDVMAIVITNGNYYVKYTDSGAIRKTTNINSAYQFSTVEEAIKGMKKAEGKPIIENTKPPAMLGRIE